MAAETIANALDVCANLCILVLQEVIGSLKRKDLINLLEANGWKYKRPGGNHDIYWKDGETRPIPVKRHKEEQMEENT
jgi:mRNA interferase HicA